MAVFIMKRQFQFTRVFSLALASLAAQFIITNTVQAQRFLVGGFGDGIYTSELQADGKMTEPKLAVKQVRPAFFAFHPTLSVLYSVTESARKDPAAPAVTAYRFDPKTFDATPVLTTLNSQSIDGDTPCHVSVDAKGEWLIAANYTSGSITLFPLGKDGAIQAAKGTSQYQGTGPNRSRQESAHAHCSVWDPTNKFVLVADLGSDKVWVHAFDREKGELSVKGSMVTAPGSGPRHIAIHKNGKWVYVINELDLTINVANWDAGKGELASIQTISTLPKDAKSPDYSTAEVLVHPNGKFVYGSNRGHHTIASFKVDEATGKLAAIGHTPTNGKTPRNFRISPNGLFLLAENQDSDSVYSFHINQETGELKPTGFSIKAPMPACIKFFDR